MSVNEHVGDTLISVANNLYIHLYSSETLIAITMN